MLNIEKGGFVTYKRPVCLLVSDKSSSKDLPGPKERTIASYKQRKSYHKGEKKFKMCSKVSNKFI